MSKSNANNPQLQKCSLGDISIGADYFLVNLPKNFILIAVKLCNQIALPADNSDYVTLTVKQGATAVASYDSRAAHEGALVALVSKAMTLDAAIAAGLVTNGAAFEIPAGDYKVTAAFAGNATLTDAKVMLYGYWK